MPRRVEREGNPGLVEGDTKGPEKISSSEVIDKPGWRAESITQKDALGEILSRCEESI
jgi:hypothetical protein